MARNTLLPSTLYAGTPIDLATPERHLASSSKAGLSGRQIMSPPSEERARRMVPPSLSANAPPTPGISARAEGSVGGSLANRSSTSGSSGQPPHTALGPASARRSRESRAATSGFLTTISGFFPQVSQPAQASSRSPK